MVDLFLDNNRAIIKDNTSFKFNIENQVFSKQGSYSFEITLPLIGCAANMDIFGSINRCEANLNHLSGTFKLVTEVLTYEGKYKITSVTDEEVKIQLIADKTLMNAESKDDKGNQLYIDELDLGFFWDEWDWYKVAHAAPESEINYPPTEVRDYSFFIDETQHRYIHAGPETSTCVCFPIKSSAVDGSTDYNQANVHTFHEVFGYCLDFPYDYRHPTFFYRDLIAMQPQLKEVIKRVFKALGYNFRSSISLLTYTYLANSRCVINYKDILPHWTVNEFIKEVCNFFNAVCLYSGNEVRLIPRKDLFNGETQTIDNVIDEFVIQIDDDSEEDFSSTGNVDYDWPVEDMILRLPDDVFERAVEKNFLYKKDMEDFVEKLPVEEKKKSRYLFYNLDDYNYYALLQNDETSKFELSRVNYYPPFIRNTNTRDISTKLRIVPVRMANKRVGQFVFDTPCMVVDDVIIINNVFSVNDTIRPSSESAENSREHEARDVIEVFYWNGYTKVSGDLPSPISVMLQLNSVTGLMEFIPFQNTASIVDPLGPFTLKERFNQDNAVSVNTTIEYNFKFLKKGPLDINRPFLINGKKYICRQLQYDCASDGVLPVVNGYFFPLD